MRSTRVFPWTAGHGRHDLGKYTESRQGHFRARDIGREDSCRPCARGTVSRNTSRTLSNDELFRELPFRDSFLLRSRFASWSGRPRLLRGPKIGDRRAATWAL